MYFGLHYLWDETNKIANNISKWITTRKNFYFSAIHLESSEIIKRDKSNKF